MWLGKGDVGGVRLNDFTLICQLAFDATGYTKCVQTLAKYADNDHTANIADPHSSTQAKCTTSASRGVMPALQHCIVVTRDLNDARKSTLRNLH